MEQKTEASQAVDERAEMIEALRMCVVALEHTGIGSRTRSIAQTNAADVLARAALKAQPAEIDPALLRALLEACDLAMKNTVAARVPECGDFGAIAQNLDYVVSRLKAQPAPTEAQGAQPSGNTGELAQGEDSARLECAHANGRTASWDWITCDDCGAIRTDTNDREWGIGKNMWFKSVSEAKFYKANGRYPDRARASAETGGVKP